MILVSYLVKICGFPLVLEAKDDDMKSNNGVCMGVGDMRVVGSTRCWMKDRRL